MLHFHPTLLKYFYAKTKQKKKLTHSLTHALKHYHEQNNIRFSYSRLLSLIYHFLIGK